MGYKETLSKVVADSGLTLREIADHCRANGSPMDPSYISKLQTGKQGPPSEEISKAIAEACGFDPDALVLEGFMEKAPKPIQDFVNEMLTFIKETALDALEMFTVKEAVPIVQDQFSKLSLLELMREIRNMVPMKELNGDKFPFFNLDEHDRRLGISPNVTYPISDNAMAPLIPSGSRVNLILQTDFDNADIVALKLLDKSILIRRIVFQGNQVILIPENKQFEVLTYPKDEIAFIGRVCAVTTDI